MLQEKWNYLIGSPDQFKLEQRIYNSFCLIALPAAVYNIPFTYSIGLYVCAAVSLTLAAIFVVAYVLSRFKNKYEISFTLAAISITLVLGVNYFFNAGIEGPNLLLLGISFLPIIVASPKKQYWIWTLFNIGVMLGISLIEFFYPDSILVHYQSRGGMFLDVVSCYLVLIIVVKVSAAFVIKSYNEARQAADEAAESLAKLNKEKDKLFSIVSHDLQAPLSSIQGYLELLQSMDLPKEKKHELELHLLQSTRSTLDMLTNVLSWSKGQMQGASINLTSLDLSELLRPTLTLYQDIARGKGIGLETNISPLIQVMADGDMLQLVVRNLVNNAVKFTSPGGHIMLSAYLSNDNSCILSVSDSGKGTPVQLSQDLFELKSKVTYGTNKEKGVGLGLVLCREFIEAQHGKIWFECHETSGVSFFIQLPVATQRATTQTHTSQMMQV